MRSKIRRSRSSTALAVLSLMFVASAATADELRLDGQPNFRDVGGYKTTNGKTVKRGMVFRSGELPRLTDGDVAKLEKLGVKTVVSFLTDVEVKARGNDRLPDGVKEIALPIAGGDDGGLAKVAHDARTTGDFSKVPVELNAEIHRLLVEEARDEYAALLRNLAKPESHPVVFHCSHGVHRTGTAAAILLSALGVPWETVRKDYLLSNDYRKKEIDRRLAALRALAAKNQGIAPEAVGMTNADAFYRLKPSYIDASRDEINKRYGSMDGYLKKGLGLTDAELRQLRAALLE